MSEDEVFASEDPFADLVAEDEDARRLAGQLAARRDDDRIEFLLRFGRIAREVIEPEFDRAVGSAGLKQRGLILEKSYKPDRHEIALIATGLKTEHCFLRFNATERESRIYRSLGCRLNLAKEKATSGSLTEDELTSPGAVRKMIEAFVSRVLEANR